MLRRILPALCGLFFLVSAESHAQYTMSVEATPAVTEGLTTYRLSIDMMDATDRLSAVYGNNEATLSLEAPMGVFNSDMNASWNASGVNPMIVASFPELAQDTYATVRLEGPASMSGLDGAADPSLVEDEAQPISPFFIEQGATSLLSNSVIGASWYVLNNATNAMADENMQVLVAQITTEGALTGTLNAQVFPLGVSANRVLLSFDFDGEGLYSEDGPLIDGCTDAMACNFDENATVNDGTCLYEDALGVCGGECAADADGDGVCDDVDDCVGTLDVCGVCNGPGAVLDCGCDPLPEGACDCDGAQLDAVGVCGGVCTADEDGDGICDDVDDCIGMVDECGVCNGPGAIYACGCTEISEGDCDCEGNVLDVLGVCGGGCQADDNANGICDEDEVLGCTDNHACNYDFSANVDDASCEYCSCSPSGEGAYTVLVESSPSVVPGHTAYRLYVKTLDVNDRLSAVFGYDLFPFMVDAPEGVFNSPMNASWNASGLMPAMFAMFPDLVDDTYATIDLDGPASLSGVDGASDPTLVEDPDQTISPFFLDNGATNLTSTSVTGASWFVTSNAGNGLAGEDMRVMFMQITTPGSISGLVNLQVFSMGAGGADVRVSVAFDGVGEFAEDGVVQPCGCLDETAFNFDPDALFDDGSCEAVAFGCIDEEACNLDPLANTDDGSCVYNDACGVCDGPGEVYECGCTDIPEGDCDCDGNQLDALGVCGGGCTADADGDGVCDDVDDCVGEYDACGVCNGPGAVFECGCDDIPAGDCDCDGNQLDALGVCGGTCMMDLDMDGVCDDVDDCVGQYDACGICNGPGAVYDCGCSGIPMGECDCNGNVLDECGVCGGPGAVYDCGCSDIPAGDCDCDGNQLDALGVCGGECLADADQDGICDDVDECVGELDECGVCNGPGATADCGCDDIPEGACDCDGNVLDAAGVCGGDCVLDLDLDGICDDEDTCLGSLDECGVCNGPGPVYGCGCDLVPLGDCDCEGNQLDALGVCGGPCAADWDGDGICDDEDDCVGEYDVCGVCNGLGEVYECGCEPVAIGECDCDGNVLDALGECGGQCASDDNCNGVCDDAEILGCTDMWACNFDPMATMDDGDCTYCGCSDAALSGYTLTVEASEAVTAGLTRYRFYIDMVNATDRMSAVYGNTMDPLVVNTPMGSFNHPGNSSWNASGLSNYFLFFYPELADDTYATIGLTGPASQSGMANAMNPALAEDPTQPISPFFHTDGASGLASTSFIGATWYVLNTASNGEADDDQRVLIMQVSTTGDISGRINVQVFPMGQGDQNELYSFNFDGEGTVGPIGTAGELECGCTDPSAANYDPEAVYDDGSCEAMVWGCTDEEACNYESFANTDNGTCQYIDECGVCGGQGIAMGACDCDGNTLDALGVCGGACMSDMDGDGVCDDVDACIGVLDACGICNGPGAIYPCGCVMPPAGDCDCDGNQLDALGVCGGDCATDVDGDGICDDVDECVGTVDVCGVCNGPGDMFTCGCDMVPVGDCDCDGNQLDAVGVCGGDCLEDLNGNGVCDTEEIEGCTDAMACNYDPAASEDDGSCDFCSCEEDVYGMTVVGYDAVTPGFTTYRFYVDMVHADDRMSAVFGNSDWFMNINAPMGAYNNAGNTSWNASGLSTAFLAVFPELADDTYATVGLTGPASESGIAGAADPSLVQDENQQITPFFLEDGATILASTTSVGASWFVLNSNDNGLPNDQGKVLIMQVTTPGTVHGTMNFQVLPHGGSDDFRFMVNFDGAGIYYDAGVEPPLCGCTNASAMNYEPTATYDDGSCEVMVWGCMNEMACNYDADSNMDNGTCEYEDECGVCGGQGIPMGACDCEGNMLDALGVCGGSCESDMDNDGICDAIDDCMGEYDDCGICNGPGAIYECGCTMIPEGDCDCDGSQVDAVGVCGGSCESDLDGNGLCDAEEGCMYDMAMNYDPEATVDNGTCEFELVDDCPSDVDGSGHVNVNDLLAFLPDYGSFCE